MTYELWHRDVVDVVDRVPELENVNVKAYPRQDECVFREIVDALTNCGEDPDGYDVGAIAHEVVWEAVEVDDDGVQLGGPEYFVPDDPEVFWDAVAANAKVGEPAQC